MPTTAATTATSSKDHSGTRVPSTDGAELPLFKAAASGCSFSIKAFGASIDVGEIDLRPVLGAVPLL